MKIKIGSNSKGYVYIDFDRTHNIFVPGACGAGKSYLEHLIIKEIKDKDPNALLILIDPKKVEFYEYKNEKNCKVFIDNSFREELNRIINNKNYNNIYIFFDEYLDNLYSCDGINNDIYNLIEESKTRNIHTIVCSQRGGNEELFNKEIVDAFDMKIILRVWNEKESNYLLGNDIGSKLKGSGDAIIIYGKEKWRFQIRQI